ncbi:MAG: hypothetical protein H6807_17225 [Planctomycetes bacterium]|nr:hypothetical protein [Planctomycetota bacterium]
MSSTTTLVHIMWTGPHKLDELTMVGASETRDFGVYQVYGGHETYGRDVLLYIGKANQQPFATRIRQGPWSNVDGEEGGSISVRLGRLSGPSSEGPPNEKVWEKLIDKAEQLLIVAHKPAWNKQNVSGLTWNTDIECRDVHVLNWGHRGDLLPEVSGEWWTQKNERDFRVWEC